MSNFGIFRQTSVCQIHYSSYYSHITYGHMAHNNNVIYIFSSCRGQNLKLIILFNDKMTVVRNHYTRNYFHIHIYIILCSMSQM